MSPRPQIGHLRRPEILSAAADVIRERGVDGTRIADISERVGTTAPAVLYYFESKAELLREALVFAEESFYAELANELARIGSARERLLWLVDSCTAAGDYDAVLWIELWPHALRGGALAVTREALDQRWREAIASIIREGQQRGEFGGGDPDEVALLAASVLDGLSIQIALGDREVSSERAHAACIAMLARELECDLSVARERRQAA